MPVTSDPHAFDLLVADPNGDFRVAQAALLFAADHCPGLKPGTWLHRLDALASRVDRLGGRSADGQIGALRTVLIDECGFRGNRDEYHDPRNSLLNEVLQRRLGIPISLSVVWLDVAERLGWPFHGVGLPGHFVIARGVPGDEIILDPFRGGRRLCRAECAALASSVTGAAVSVMDDCFRPAGKRAILTRMLANLCSIHHARGDWTSVARVLRRLIALDQNSSTLRRHVELVALRLAEQN